MISSLYHQHRYHYLYVNIVDIVDILISTKLIRKRVYNVIVVLMSLM